MSQSDSGRVPFQMPEHRSTSPATYNPKVLSLSGNHEMPMISLPNVARKMSLFDGEETNDPGRYTPKTERSHSLVPDIRAIVPRYSHSGMCWYGNVPTPIQLATQKGSYTPGVGSYNVDDFKKLINTQERLKINTSYRHILYRPDRNCFLKSYGGTETPGPGQYGTLENTSRFGRNSKIGGFIGTSGLGLNQSINRSKTIQKSDFKSASTKQSIKSPGSSLVI